MRLSAFESWALHALESCTPRSNRLTLCSSARSPCSSCSTIFSNSASCSSKLGIHRGLIPQPQHLGSRRKVTKRRADLHSLHLVANLGQHLLRDCKSNRQRRLLVRRFGHARENGIR